MFVLTIAAQVIQAKNNLENVLVTGTYSPQPALVKRHPVLRTLSSGLVR